VTSYLNRLNLLNKTSHNYNIKRVTRWTLYMEGFTITVIYGYT